MKNIYYKRLIEQKINDRLKISSVLIEGPRWCGKTSTGLKLSKSSFFMLNNQEYNILIAKSNPMQILAGNMPRLIDEWQIYPNFWNTIKTLIDKNRDKYKYILTGSVVPPKNDLRHSGAGRIIRVRMRPMSLYEQKLSSGLISLKDLFKNKPINFIKNNISLDAIIDWMIIGGWPININQTVKNAKISIDSYIESLKLTDISTISNVKKDYQLMEYILISLSRLNGCLGTNNSVYNDINKHYDKVHRNTVDKYINIFNNLFLLEYIYPFRLHSRSSKIFKTAPKRYLCDPSIGISILKITNQTFLSDFETLGIYFENLVIKDLLTYADSIGAKLYFLSGDNGFEIDAIIELEDGKWGAVEIKLSDRYFDQAAKDLLSIEKKFDLSKKNKPSFLAIITSMNFSYTREDGVHVISIHMLKD